MHTLYPPIEPFHTERLAVDDRHELYLEQCGNPDGLPVIFLHGGPGAGLAPYHRQFFDPARYRIVLFDQRGAGKSTPFADLTDNTTWDLVNDIEAIREHLGIDKWVVFGGSWGSTLSLAYGQAHPERTLALVLRGIFLCRPEDIDWYYEIGGAAMILPEKWERFVSLIPEAERGNMLEAYWKRLNSDDEDERLTAARTWGRWEGGGLTLKEDPDMEASFGSPEVALSLARTEAHYFRNRGFLQPDQLLHDVDKVRHIPTTIVHGRYDLCCPAKNAIDLARVWPEADLHMVLAGHAASEPAIVDVLVETTDALATRFA
ncbi:MAG TPA: prolyl aminopeptidase [Oleiagrimonas sp.]|nr:prolyl aminopeptidase [Oleiagrimonas sp.]